MITLSIITPTQGRKTLDRTLASLTHQLGDGDEILVIRRDNVPFGNATRDEAIPRCLGSHLWWMDDDDVATPDALEVIRECVGGAPEAINIFKMRYGTGEVLWVDEEFGCGRVGGTMCVVPNVPGKMGSWVHKAVSCGDWNFLDETHKMQGGPLVFHDHVVAIIRPSEDPQ